MTKIAVKKNLYRRLPAGRRKTAKKYHDQFTLVYRKEGEIVVETNPGIDPCGGRDGADLYLEREVKTYNLVDECVGESRVKMVPIVVFHKKKSHTEDFSLYYSNE